MAGGTEPPTPGTGVSFACPRCGAPLPLPGADGFATCDYCGVRTEVALLAPSPPAPTPPELDFRAQEPPRDSAGEDDSRGIGLPRLVRIVIALVAVVIVIALIAASQPPSTPGSSSAAHCSVTIGASADSGPAPFTATFTANVTVPAGDSAGQPMWQFGPFPPGIDLNYTYGSTVAHTWDTEGSFGVHVTVPDSTGQGCYTTMTVTVT